MRHDVLVGERLHPATKRPRAPAPDQLQVMLGQHLGDELVVTGGASVFERLVRPPAGPEPPRRASMDLVNGARVLRGEPEAGELREERMDAVPTAVLEPDHEQVRAFELGQEVRRIGAAQHAVGELRGAAAEDRDAEEEGALRRWERIDDLMAQVVGEEAMIPAEPLHRRARILDGAQPESGQQDRGGPTLRPRVEELQLLGLELDPLAVENVGRLGLGERQLSRAKLGQRPAGPQLRKPERRVGARDRDHASVRRDAPERVFDRGERIRIGHGLEIVEDQHELPAVHLDAVHELVHRALDRTVGELQLPHGLRYEVAADAPDGGRDVGPHADRVVVTRVQRHPCQRSAPGGGPGADRGGLPVSGGRGDERERGSLAGVERLHDARPLDDPGGRPQRSELRLGEQR